MRHFQALKRSSVARRQARGVQNAACGADSWHHTLYLCVFPPLRLCAKTEAGGAAHVAPKRIMSWFRLFPARWLVLWLWRWKWYLIEPATTEVFGSEGQMLPSITGLTRSREYHIFFACGSVEKTLFPPNCRRRRQFGGKNRKNTALPKVKRRVDDATA